MSKATNDFQDEALECIECGGTMLLALAWVEIEQPLMEPQFNSFMVDSDGVEKKFYCCKCEQVTT